MISGYFYKESAIKWREGYILMKASDVLKPKFNSVDQSTSSADSTSNTYESWGDWMKTGAVAAPVS